VLTIFSIPKPFRGHIEVIQRNAIQSWARLGHGCEVLLFGDEDGTGRVAEEYGATWVPDVRRNRYGTPLLDAVFAHSGAVARNGLLCYVNADIILLGDFLRAVRQVRQHRFLMVGQRWDLDLRVPYDFGRPGWEGELRQQVAARGALHPPSGSDYFVFRKGDRLGELPPFAVGRPGWDNWLIYRARTLNAAVIDATRVTTVIHQNHDYAHVPQRTDDGWEGPEADENRRLMGSGEAVFTLLDATHVLDEGGVRRPLAPRYLLRRWKTLPALMPRTSPWGQLLSRVQSAPTAAVVSAGWLLRRLGLYHPVRRLLLRLGFPGLAPAGAPAASPAALPR
jgi:hypothetical protein